MTTGKMGSASILKVSADEVTQLIGTEDENMVVNVRVVNIGAISVTPITVSIAIGSGSAPDVDGKDWIVYQDELAHKELIESTGLSISMGEKIWVRVDGAIGTRAAVRVHGMVTH